MPYQPINFVYLGDLYRFYVDYAALPDLDLNSVEFYESGMTHCVEVEWDSVPLILKEMLFDKLRHHATLAL